jgi:hypothetical protein
VSRDQRRIISFVYWVIGRIYTSSKSKLKILCLTSKLLLVDVKLSPVCVQSKGHACFGQTLQ